MSNSFKIIFATGIMPPAIGGPAVYTVQLKKHLEALGHSARVITYGDSQTVDTWAKDNVLVVDKKASLLGRYWRYFILLYQATKKADIIYAHDLISTGLPASLVKNLQSKKKLVLRLGGDFLWEKAYNQAWTNKPLSQYYGQPKNFKEKIYLAVYKFVLNKADKIIFSTQWQAGLAKKYLAVPDTKIAVINNPFPINTEKDHHFDKIELLLAGRLIPLKNIVRIIKLIPKLEGVSLKIVGDGPQKKELVSLVKDLQLEARVDFLAGVNSETLTKLISSTYLVLVPSISDISPNIVLEAVALHKPVVVSKESGYYQDYKEQLIFVDPFDEVDILEKIKYLLDSRNYKNYQERLAKIDTSRSWPALVQEHLALFEKLL